MTARVRMLIAVARPAVLVLLGVYAALGAARGGRPQDVRVLGWALAATAAYLVFSVAVNDLADEAVDRVNLPRASNRPLVAGTARRADLRLVEGVAAVLAVLCAAPLGWACCGVVCTGLAVSAAYSLLLSGRGAVASLVLPACYVAVPYLLGLLGSRALRAGDLLLLAGLYTGFTGRILLKDFRDVRGDALFGKRTFLVRHGRAATCVFSACCWVAGGLLLALAVPSIAYAVTTGLGALAAVGLLRALARDPGHRRDELLISAVAIVGRGILAVLLVQLTAPAVGWSLGATSAAVIAVGVVFAGQTWSMLRHGPAFGRTVPSSWTTADEEATA